MENALVTLGKETMNKNGMVEGISVGLKDGVQIGTSEKKMDHIGNVLVGSLSNSILM